MLTEKREPTQIFNRYRYKDQTFLKSIQWQITTNKKQQLQAFNKIQKYQPSIIDSSKLPQIHQSSIHQEINSKIVNKSQPQKKSSNNKKYVNNFDDSNIKEDQILGQDQIDKHNQSDFNQSGLMKKSYQVLPSEDLTLLKSVIDLTLLKNVINFGLQNQNKQKEDILLNDQQKDPIKLFDKGSAYLFDKGSVYLYKYCIILLTVCQLINKVNTSSLSYVEVASLTGKSYNNVYNLKISQDYKTVYVFYQFYYLRIYNFIDSSLILKQQIQTGINIRNFNRDVVHIWNNGAKIFIAGYNESSLNNSITIYDYDGLNSMYKTNQSEYFRISFDHYFYIQCIQVNKRGDLLLIKGKDGIINKYFYNGNSWFQAYQNISLPSNLFIMAIEFMKQQQKLFVFTQSSALIMSVTNSSNLSISFSFRTDQNYQYPDTCKISPDQNIISCFYGISKLRNYMINLENNTVLNLNSQISDSRDVFMDNNRIFTVFNSFQILRYQLNIIGSSYQYTLIDSVQLPVMRPYLLTSQSQSKFQLVYAQFTSSYKLYLLKYPCNNTIKNCVSCQKDNSTKCIFCSQQYLLENNLCLNCAPGYYENNSICIQCTVKFCKTCPDSSCRQCLTGYTLKNGTCLNCDIGYYKINNLCLKCPYGCYNCTDGNLTSCISCNNEYYLYMRKCLLCTSNCMICKNSSQCLTCYSGYYNLNNRCQPCATNCQNCTNTSVCLSCKLSYFNLNNLCVACGFKCSICTSSSVCTTCMNEYFLNGSICSSCDIIGCSICTSTKSCTTCLAGYIEMNSVCCTTGTTLCYKNGTSASCNSGYFLSSENCVACLQNCQNCSNTVNCTNCFTGYISTSDGICSQCDFRYYLSGNSCLPCPINCDFCTASLCENCSTGFTLVGSQCCPPQTKVCNSDGTILSCNGGFYKQINICQPCISNCQVCSDSKQCQTCNSAFKLTLGLCDSCSNGYFNNSLTCQACVSNCSTCNNSIECIECSVGNFLVGNICQPCLTHCDYCNDSTSCITCSPGYEYNESLCNICAVGYYNDENGLCSACKNQCRICQTLEKCTQCHQGYTLVIDEPYSCGANISQCQSCNASLNQVMTFLYSSSRVSNTVLIMYLPLLAVIIVLLAILDKMGALKSIINHIFNKEDQQAPKIQQQPIQEYVSKIQSQNQKMKQNKSNSVIQHLNKNKKQASDPQQYFQNNVSSLQSLYSSRDTNSSVQTSYSNIFKNKLRRKNRQQAN